MKTIEYQEPQMFIRFFDEEDIVRTSGITEGEQSSREHDKGVEDFFGN